MAGRAGAVPAPTIAFTLALALGLGACGGAGAPASAAPAGATTDASHVEGVPTTPAARSTTAAIETEGPPFVGDVDVARLATGETPADWVEIRSNDDACRQAVPPDWVDSGLPGHVLSPEIHVTSIVANDPFTGWDDHVAYLQATYFADGQEVVVENERLFLLRSTERGGASHVLALRGDASACGIVLAIDEAGIGQYAAIGVQILYTLDEIR